MSSTTKTAEPQTEHNSSHCATSDGVGRDGSSTHLPTGGAGRTIVLVSRDYPPLQCGGIATFVHSLAHGLLEQGHHIHVITKAAKGQAASLENDGGVQVHRIRERLHWRSWKAMRMRIPRRIWRWSSSAMSAVIRLSQTEAIDLVEAPIWACEGAAFLLDRRWPLVTSLHTTLHTWMESNPRRTSSWWWLYSFGKPMLALEAMLMTQADAVRANSRAILREIEGAYGLEFDASRTRVIPHGLPPPRVVAPPRHAHDMIELLFVGRLEQRKGIQILLQALPPLMQRWPGLCVRLIGDTQIRNAAGHFDKEDFLARHQGADWLPRVVFEGRVSDGRVLQAYAKCDIFVGPSLFESFGMVFIEAMRQGKPVIACHAGGMPEVVEDGRTGLLVPPGDAHSLEQAIERLLQDPAMRQRLGTAARRAYECRFTAQRMAEESLPLYTLAQASFNSTQGRG
ncbi:MAG: Glycogen synthase [Burkholderia gladioli]|nr:MAG: Glycogen synthase [Burkholderia gladioli]